VLLHRSGITRSLGRPAGVFTDLVFKFVWQSVSPLPLDLPEKSRKSRKKKPIFWKYSCPVLLLRILKRSLAFRSPEKLQRKLRRHFASSICGCGKRPPEKVTANHLYN
jgi:hypothetical protein